MAAALSSLENLLRSRGPTGLTDVAKSLGCATKTAQRLLAAAAGAVIAAGQTRRRRFAWRREFRPGRNELPLYCIDPEGHPQALGVLRTVWPQGCQLEFTAQAWPVDPQDREGWYEGLPYPLYDLQPQGFLGRALARQHHERLGVSPDPRQWDDDAVLLALAELGGDLPGDLLLGDTALRRFLDTKLRPPSLFTPADYPGFAARALEGGHPGSSAGGEFPKFLVARELAGMATPHCVVKFTGADDSATVQRWRDLLVCEQLAAEALGADASRTRLLIQDGRHFLESERFDRVGVHGRRGVLSLSCINAGLVGEASDDWARVTQRLTCAGWLSAADAERAAERQLFGRLIGNTDMHGGNLGFFVGANGFQLAPSYDQLPMRYAPLAGGEVMSPELAPALPLPAERERWRCMAPLAISFWQAAAVDPRISPSFQRLCADNAVTLQRAARLA